MKLTCATVAVAFFGFNACSQLTDVSAPDVVQPTSLDNAVGAETMRAGAVGLFATAYAGVSGQVIASGMIADELTSASSAATNYTADTRVVADKAPSSEYPLSPLYVARLQTMQAIPKMQQFLPLARPKIGQLFANLAFTELFLAENMCSGVPLSSVANGEPVYGQPLTTAGLLDQAISDLDSAAVYAADSVRVLNMVRVARGRVLLDRGKFPEAAVAVAAVPTGYVFQAEFTATSPNGFFTSSNQSRIATVSDREGTNGLDFRSANDGRLRTVLMGKGTDAVTDVYIVDRFNSATAAVPLANGVEARLIESEAALKANPNDNTTTGSGWLGILNTLRSSAITPALPALADPGSPAARVDLLFRERAFWLFGTGHRHGDLRRLIRQYGRPTEQVFPTGSYKGRSLYGTDVTYTVPVTEAPNPNWSGKCLDRNP
jgi:hypothetical protein